MSKLKDIIRETQSDTVAPIYNNLEALSVINSLEGVDDDDLTLITEAIIEAEINKTLSTDENIDDGFTLLDPPCGIDEKPVDYPSENIKFFEDTTQGLHEFENNLKVDEDTEDQIKAIIEAMKMDW